jgi:hypothetical protein
LANTLLAISYNFIFDVGVLAGGAPDALGEFPCGLKSLTLFISNVNAEARQHRGCDKSAKHGHSSLPMSRPIPDMRTAQMAMEAELAKWSDLRSFCPDFRP